MKKRIIKNLGLNKKLISNLNFENIKGGAQSDATNCTPVAACQPTQHTCTPPQTAAPANTCVTCPTQLSICWDCLGPGNK